MCECRYPGGVRRGYLSPGARVAGVCNLPDMGAGDSIWVLCSQELRHLSSLYKKSSITYN